MSKQRQKRKKNESDEQEHSERSRSRQRVRIFQEKQLNEEENNEDDDNEGEEGSGSNEQSISGEQNFAQTIAIQIRSAYLDFFGRIKNEKAFVFTPQQRNKMQKQQQRLYKKDRSHQRIDWKSECEWDLDEQKQKIDEIFDKQALKLSEQKLELLKQIFLNSSYLFGNQTTDEVYAMLMAILKICLRSGSHTIESQSNVKRFMSELRKDSNNNFKFFNYKFSSYHRLPQERELQKQNENLQDIYFRLGVQISKQLHKALIEE